MPHNKTDYKPRNSVSSVGGFPTCRILNPGDSTRLHEGIVSHRTLLRQPILENRLERGYDDLQGVGKNHTKGPSHDCAAIQQIIMIHL